MPTPFLVLFLYPLTRVQTKRDSYYRVTIPCFYLSSL